MTIYSMNGGKQLDIKGDISNQAAHEITSMEHFNSLLLDARYTATKLLATVEETRRLNKQEAVKELQRSLIYYEKVIRTISPFTERGWLRYYYESIKSAATNEMNVVKGLFQAVLLTNNDVFNKEYKRYLSLLDDISTNK